MSEISVVFQLKIDYQKVQSRETEKKKRQIQDYIKCTLLGLTNHRVSEAIETKS